EIAALEEFNIDAEIENHRRSKDWYAIASEVAQLEKDTVTLERQLVSVERQIAEFRKQETSALEHNCPTCGQDIHDDSHSKILVGIQARLAELEPEKTALFEGVLEVAKLLEAKVGELAALGEE